MSTVQETLFNPIIADNEIIADYPSTFVEDQMNINRAIAQELNQLKTEVNNFKQEIVEKSNNINDLYTKNAGVVSDLKTSNANFSLLYDEIAKERGIISDIENQTDQTNKKTDIMKNDIEQIKNKVERFADLQNVEAKEIGNVKNKIEKMTNLFDEDYVHLNNELNSISKKYITLENKSKDDSSKLHSLEKNTESLAKQQAENVVYFADISTKYENRITDTTDKIKEIKNTLAVTDKSVDDMEKKIETLLLKNNFLVEKISSNEKQMEKINTRSVFIENQLIHIIGENMDYALSIKEKDRKIDELTKKYETQLSNVMTKIAELESELKTATKTTTQTAQTTQTVPTDTIGSTNSNKKVTNLPYNSRREKSKTQPIFLKKITTTGSTRTVVCEIIGTTGNIYHVNLVGYPKCSCPDYCLRGLRCKHIYYALENVLHISNSSKEYYSFSELVDNKEQNKLVE